jgi:hypothetical protein
MEAIAATVGLLLDVTVELSHLLGHFLAQGLGRNIQLLVKLLELLLDIAIELGNFLIHRCRLVHRSESLLAKEAGGLSAVVPAMQALLAHGFQNRTVLVNTGRQAVALLNHLLLELAVAVAIAVAAGVGWLGLGPWLGRTGPWLGAIVSRRNRYDLTWFRGRWMVGLMHGDCP